MCVTSTGFLPVVCMTHLILLYLLISGVLLYPDCDLCVIQVVDQYLNFISLEEDLFITKHQDTRELSYYGKPNFLFPSILPVSPISFILFSSSSSLLYYHVLLFSLALNRPDVQDTAIDNICNTIVSSLFSVFVTAGKTPKAMPFLSNTSQEHTLCGLILYYSLIIAPLHVLLCCIVLQVPSLSFVALGAMLQKWWLRNWTRRSEITFETLATVCSPGTTCPWPNSASRDLSL